MRRTILLNPGPVTTTNSVKNALLIEDICHRESEFITVLNDIRRKLLQLAGANDDYATVLFASSGTGAIEACISSLIAKDKALAVINNGAYGQRIIDMAKRYQLRVIELTYAPELPLPLAQIEHCIASNPDISYLALVHHETSSGILNPLRELGDLCSKYSCGFLVDAMSSFGGADIDVIRDHVDFLVSSANKCIQGMAGMAFVIGKKSRLQACQHVSRSYYFDLYQQYQTLEKTGQLSYTAPVQIVYALQQALDELLAETIPSRIKRYHTNYAYLVKGLEIRGFKLLTPADRASQLLVTVGFPNDGLPYSFTELHAMLFQSGITIYPAKTDNNMCFRLACIGDLTCADIETFLQKLSQYLLTVRQININIK